MKIIVNGNPLESQTATIAALLSELGYGDAVVATALNGNFLPAGLRTTTTLSEGDRLEILSPMQGG